MSLPASKHDQHGGGRHSRGALIVLVALFIVTRLIAWTAGLRFDASPLGDYWQYLDPELLRGDLLRSLYELHAQPPGFNLSIGLILKLFGSAAAQALGVLYTGCGLLTTVTVFLLLCGLGVSRGISFAAAALMAIQPSFLLLENWLMYDLPMACTVALSALALLHFTRSGSAGALGMFVTSVFALSISRSLFHLSFVLAATVVVAVLLREERKKVLLAVLPALLLLLSLYAKNYVLVGSFGPSSWLGMNLARIATSAFSQSELEELVAAGQLSAVVAVPPFSPLDRYPHDLELALEGRSHPAVADRYKSNGRVNYNHHAYAHLARRYRDDALWLITHYPGRYLHGMAKAWYNYLRPPSEIRHLATVRKPIERYVEAADRVFYGRPFVELPYAGGTRPIYPLAWIAFLAVTAHGTWALTRLELDRAQRVVIAYLLLVVGYVALVGNGLEVWENQRFRFMTEPALVVLGGLLAERLVRSFRRLADPLNGTATDRG